LARSIRDSSGQITAIGELIDSSMLHPQGRPDQLGRHPTEGRGQPAVSLVAEGTSGLGMRQYLVDLGMGSGLRPANTEPYVEGARRTMA
jgi:hypothetical protein